MFKKFSNKQLIVIVFGIIFFILATLLGGSIPYLGKPSLPIEIKNITKYFGLSEYDISNIILKYLPHKTTNNTNNENNMVTRVIDGDTIEVNGNIIVRLIGINAPEKDSAITKAECWNKEATNNITSLVLGKNIKLVKDLSETDKYGRLLRYVYVENIFINEELVKNGSVYAKAYPPDILKKELLFQAQNDAKNNKMGLWGFCNIK